MAGLGRAGQEGTLSTFPVTCVLSEGCERSQTEGEKRGRRRGTKRREGSEQEVKGIKEI